MGNLNQRSEIIAIRAAGVNFFQLVKPYFFLGILFTSLLYFHQQKIVSKSYRQMKKTIKQIHHHHIVAFVRPGTFTTLDKTVDKRRVLYVGNTIERNGRSILKNLQIKTIQKTGKGKKIVQFIIAKEAEKVKKESKSGKAIHTLRLFGGYAIMQDMGGEEIQFIDFNNSSFDIHLIPPNETSLMTTKLVLVEFSGDELIEQYEHLKATGHPYEAYIPYITEYHKRIALSFSVLLFMLLGFPVAIINQRTEKGFGLGLAIIFIFSYYALYFSSDGLVTKYQFLPPFIITWLGNFVMGIFIIYFARKRFFILS